MERAKIEKELEDLVKETFKCGGWRIEQGIMPVIVFTLPEARLIAEKLKEN